MKSQEQSDKEYHELMDMVFSLMAGNRADAEVGIVKIIAQAYALGYEDGKREQANETEGVK